MNSSAVFDLSGEIARSALTQNLAGQNRAALFLHALEVGCPTGDELSLELTALVDTGSDEALRGFSRVLQKALGK